jgi:multidrug resistance efflux pump
VRFVREAFVFEPFSRSLRSLRADSFRITLGALVLAGVLLLVWGVWFFFAEVSIYAVTETARLEVDQQAHPVDAPISGRVVATYLRLGKQVQQGDLLLELDFEQIRYQLEETKAKKTGLSNQLEKLREEILAQTQALRQAHQAENSARDEALAQHQEAIAAARLADEEARRIARMHDEGLVPEAERTRADAEAEQRRAAASARQRSLKRLEADRRFEQSEKRALLAELERQAEVLQAELATSRAADERLEHQLQLHQISAPVSGRLGEVVPLQEGSFIDAGDRLAAVIPPGVLRVVAEFDPPDALGRVRPSQDARLRLEGFPWVQYGSIPATVDRVANETQNGKIRVELTVDPELTFPISLQHGLPGTLEVEVEKISPAALVLRAAGRVLTRPAGGRGSRATPADESR